MSCHLYPIRVKYFDFEDFKIEAIYYHKWSICKPACTLGESLKVPVYQFLKEPLTAKYGADWYNQLLDAAKVHKEEKESPDKDE